MTETMIVGHAAFVTVHAVAAFVALVAAVITLHTGRGLTTHRVAVVVMAVCLGPSLAFGWAGFSTLSRVIFFGLAGLAVFMVGQSVRAARVRALEIGTGQVVVLSTRPGVAGVGPKFVGTLGFNAIALTVAGTIVPVLRVGGGTVGVIICVAVSVGIGHVLVERRRRAVDAAVQRRTAAVEPLPVAT